MPTRSSRKFWLAIAFGVATSVALAVFVARPPQPGEPASASLVRQKRTRSHSDPTLPSSERVAAQASGLRSTARTTELVGKGPGATGGGAPAIAGQLVLNYTPGTSPEERRAARDVLDVRLVTDLHPLPAEVVSFSGGGHASVQRAADAHPAVDYAEPNFIYRVADTNPNDPSFKNLWGLENTAQTILGTVGVADADIDAAGAWDTTQGSKTVPVGVVDSGVDATHVDLAPNIWTNPGESGGGRESNGIDDDNNGYIDDWRGWDWIDKDNDATDRHGHGTHVAGTIGARGGDGFGITGVNWEVGLVPLRVLGADGSGSSAGISAAFAYAGKMGIPVVNASLGGPGFSQTLSDTIARYPDTLYVVAAGNDATNNEVTAQYPCNYTAANLICVASTTNKDQLSSFSNYGSKSVDVAAPGSGILSTVPSFIQQFHETFETDLSGRWLATGSWGRDQDTAGSFLSDTPGSRYSGPSHSHITTQAPIDLSGGTGCRLEYDLKLDVVAGRDVFAVEASQDGNRWTTISEWSGSTSSRWFSMSDPLDAFDGSSSTLLRLRLITGDGSEGAGADIDNVAVRCLSRTPSTRYSYYSGTSMASPHVAGAAGLLWAAAPNPSAALVKGALLRGGETKAGLTDKVTTGARLNAARSLGLLGLGEVDTTSPSAPAPAAPTATQVPTPPTAAPSPTVARPAPGPSPSGSAGTTPVASPTSATPSASPTPSPREHDRSVSLRLKGELVARGRVTPADGFNQCAGGVPLKIFRNGDRIAKTITSTDGSYRVRLRNRSGRYLAVASLVLRGDGTDRCAVATSHESPGTLFRANASGTDPAHEACANHSNIDLDLAASLNGARADAGLDELVLDEVISAGARAHVAEMAATRTVFNLTAEELRQRLAGPDEAGMVVGSGSDGPTLFSALMASPIQRGAILGRDYSRVGVASTEVGGRTWVAFFVASATPDESQLSFPCPTS